MSEENVISNVEDNSPKNEGVVEKVIEIFKKLDGKQSKVHEVLETGAGIDDGRKAHQRGGQQQGIDAGGKACNQVLNNVALEILIIGNN